MSANDKQIAGSHYKDLKVQVWDFIVQNNIPYLEGNIIKYVTRWKDKGGVADLQKARHYLEKLLESSYKEVSNDLSASKFNPSRIPTPDFAGVLPSEVAKVGHSYPVGSLSGYASVGTATGGQELGLRVRPCIENYSERLKEQVEAQQALRQHHAKY
jgi:hypothetical protein